MKQHTDFFFDNLKVFLVEDTLFRVPIKKLVDESEYFKHMFEDGSPAVDPKKGEEGATMDHPIMIGDESANDFAILMRWLYERHTTNAFASEEWAICLRMAHKFGVPLLSQAAQSALENATLDPIMRVRLCFDYDLDLAWAKDAVSTMCYSWNQLPLLPEADTLPLKFRHECLKIRETISKTRVLPNGYYGAHWCDGCGNWRFSMYRSSEGMRSPLQGRERCTLGCGDPTALYMVAPQERKESVTQGLLTMFSAQRALKV